MCPYIAFSFITSRRLSLIICSLSFLGVKVYETQERDLVIEPAVRWAGNPNITIVVNVFSLQMTVQVSNHPN